MMAASTPVRGVRVRFAPSPTGYLHIGGLRTALYNWLFARKHRGTFILRLEDTDRARLVPDAEADIIEALAWAGLDFDEGPGRGGPHEPYYQSLRTDIYRRVADELIRIGRAYYAFDTPEEIERMRQGREAQGETAPRYDARTRLHMQNSLTLPPEEVRRRLEAGAEHVVRLRIDPGRTVRIDDLIRGSVRVDTSELDDPVLLKSDGLPTYHLANVVDDHHMGITHVIRGEEWLPSVPKHLLLYEYLAWDPPRMAHLPLILSPGGGKLSKRHAETMGIPVNVRDYRQAGYDPDALINFLAFLGWNPGTERELFSREELIDAYSIERTGQSSVQFNLDKLRWYNAQYVRSKPLEALVEEVRPHLRAAGIDYEEETLRRAVELMRERITFPHDVATQGRYFFEDPVAYEEAGVRKRWKEDSSELVQAYARRIEGLPAFSAAALEAALRELAEERGIGAGRIIHPVRLAVSGTTAGPGLFEVLEVVGREAVVRRLRRAAELLGA